MKGHFGVRWQAQRDTAFDGARITESGVALRLPAHSKMRDTRPPMSFRWFLAFTLAFSLQSLAFASDPVLGEAIECANLIYAGTKSSVCFSEEFLSAVASETSINTARKFKPVKLAEKEAFRFPFAVMTGEGGFTLTDDERKNLKLYLEKGGFLLASAGCSSKEWGESFTREMQTLFPERKLADVPMDHPIFRTVYDVTRLDI